MNYTATQYSANEYAKWTKQTINHAQKNYV